MEYKHYIRLDKNNRIIAAFSDAFETPQDGDILYRESDERHFHLELYREDGFLRYECEWNGKEIVFKSKDILLAESNAKKIAELKKYIYDNWLDSAKTQDEIKKEFKKLNNGLSKSVDGDIEKFKKWMEEE